MIEHAPVARHEFAIRNLAVARTTRLSPGFVRVTITGPELADFASYGPADHAKLYFADQETGIIATPRLTAGGLQPPESGTVISRDYTPRAFRAATDNAGPELDLDFFVHSEGGAATEWVNRADQDSTLVVAGPRGSRLVPTGATRVILGADETALPALARWIELLPDTIEILAFVEIDNESDAAYLDPDHVNRARVVWLHKCDGGLERAIRGLGPIGDDCYVWIAGEATTLIPIRRYLRRELGLTGDQVKIVGYWKRGVSGRDHHAPIDPSDPVD